jgi:hypothetical protein
MFTGVIIEAESLKYKFRPEDFGKRETKMVHGRATSDKSIGVDWVSAGFWLIAIPSLLFFWLKFVPFVWHTIFG